MLTLIIKPTHRCNMNCVYCYDRVNRELDKSTMTLETVENIFKVASTKTNKIAVVWHGGEPLLMDIKNFYLPIYETILPKYFDLKNVKSGFQTNGTIFTPEIIAFCEKYKIDIGSSYDGITNNETRKNTEKLKENIYKARICEFDGWRAFLMVVTKDNVHTIIDSYEESIKEGFNLAFNEIFNDESEKVALEEMDIIIKEYMVFLNYLLDREDLLIPRPFIQFLTLILELKDTPVFCNQIHCLGKWLGIQPNGEAYPCGRDWVKEFAYGNINDMRSFGDVVNSPVYKDLEKGVEEVKERCSDCKLYHMCHGGCPHTAYKHNKNIHIKDRVQCFYTKKMYTNIMDVLTARPLSEIKNRDLLALLRESKYISFKSIPRLIGKETNE